MDRKAGVELSKGGGTTTTSYTYDADDRLTQETYGSIALWFSIITTWVSVTAMLACQRAGFC